MGENSVYCLPAIAVACYLLIELVKAVTGGAASWKSFYPVLSAFIGMGLGAALFFVDPEWISESLPGAILIGAASGLSATGGDQIGKRLSGFFHRDEKDGSEK